MSAMFLVQMPCSGVFWCSGILPSFLRPQGSKQCDPHLPGEGVAHSLVLSMVYLCMCANPTKLVTSLSL